MAKKAAKSPKKILLSFIQDRSGSMANVWTETLSGFKTYVQDMKADQDSEVEYIFSLTAFDTQIDKPYLGVPIASVDGEMLTKFGPRGGTALYDAVGKTLQAIDDDKSITFDKAIVIICTDGEENQSREWSKRLSSLQPSMSGSSAATGRSRISVPSLRHGRQRQRLVCGCRRIGHLQCSERRGHLRNHGNGFDEHGAVGAEKIQVVPARQYHASDESLGRHDHGAGR